MSTLRVGHLDDNAAYLRNIVGRVPEVRYLRVFDLNRAYVHILHRLGLDPHPHSTVEFRYNDLGLWPVDLLHFFNNVSFGPTPWFVTFESLVPRFWLPANHPRFRRGLEALASDRCRGLIALSHCSLRLQMNLLNEFPALARRIEHKLTVLHPPQRILVSLEEKDFSGPLRLMFVGSAFFRKGGAALLQSLGNLRKRTKAFTLLIVSSLQKDPSVAQETDEDVQAARRFIATNSEWIEWHQKLSNLEVLGKMKKAHIGLLPTYADTYAYSVLEFQASGSPVISTDVRALPEINNDRVGWVLPVPRGPSGEGKYATQEERDTMRAAIVDGLSQAVESALDQRRVVACKAADALLRIQAEHSPEKHSVRLRGLYLGAERRTE